MSAAFSSSSAIHADVASVAAQVARANVWRGQEIRALARRLLVAFDSALSAHCAEAAGESHAAACKFRALPCTNEGCSAVFSALHEGRHDTLCEFKIVDCEQKCGVTLRRRDMRAHCDGPCDLRRVKCAYSAVGCDKPVLALQGAGGVNGAAFSKGRVAPPRGGGERASLPHPQDRPGSLRGGGLTAQSHSVLLSDLSDAVAAIGARTDAVAAAQATAVEALRVGIKTVRPARSGRSDARRRASGRWRRRSAWGGRWGS